MGLELTDIDLKELIEGETGRKFNKENKILSPLSNEKTPSFAIYFDSNNNKYKFKDFSTGKGGDCIDFIMELKGFDYNQAREYLGLAIKKTEIEIQSEKIEKYIKWEQNHYRKGQELLGLFPLVNKDNEIVYFKAKFKVENGKKLAYYHTDNGKVINKRKGEELPYNLYNVIRGIRDDKVIIICEGERDANVLNNLLDKNKYIATSVKNVKDLSVFQEANLYICGDTGEAGEKYIQCIKKQLFDCCNMFKIINLPGIKELGNNKDVTDFLEAGHNKKDLIKAFKRSLDLKNKHELQQDWNGVYKTISKDGVDTKVYITDFIIEKACNIKFVEENSEGIKLILKTSLDTKIQKIGYVNAFDDVKSFRAFLNSLDLTFKGSTNDLMVLKIWIRKYFALEDEKVHLGTRFINNDDGISLVTNDGALKNGAVDPHTLAQGGAKINALNGKPINKEELQELKGNIFNFATLDKTYSIVGTVINNLAIAQAMELNVKLHHLLIVGESGSGKSTILENVIASILNYPKDDMKSIGEITRFALIKNLSEGNYPILFEEHKPSRMRESQILMVSEILRNLYDRHSIDRGNRSLINKTFPLTRPLIMAGEERYANSEKALYERSCIVYISKGQRTKEQTSSMNWIIDHQEILNKLGRSIVEQIINLPVEDYDKIRKEVASRIKGLKDRPLNTAINICTGIEILNKLFNNLGIEKVQNYENLIVKNIIDEIVDNENATGSEVEEILLLYNEMIENNRAFEPQNVIRIGTNDTVKIRTNEMFDQILEHIKKIGLKKQILDKKDFKRQAQLAGYILKLSGGTFSVNNKDLRADVYSKGKLLKLKVYEIVPPDYIEVNVEEGEQQIFSNVTSFKFNPTKNNLNVGKVSGKM